MASGGSAIRGSRVGAGPMGEQDRGFHAERVAVSYWDALGNETVRHFAANLPAEPQRITVTNCSQDFLTSYWIRTTPALAARFAPGSAYSNPPARILLATTRYNCHRRPGTTLHVVSREGVPLVYVIEQAGAR